MLARPSFFADIVHPSARRNIACAIALGVWSACPASRCLMNHAFSANRHASRNKRLAEPIAERANAAQVLQRHGLPAARVVGDGDHHQRHAIAVFVERPLERSQVDVALEGMHQRRHAAFGDHEVARLGAFDLDVGARRIEVVVVGDDVAGLQDRVEEDALGRPPLMRRDDVAKTGEVLHDGLKAVERAAAGVRLVALHQGAPLRRRHRAGARVGEQVDEHVVAAQEEDVAAGLVQRATPRCLVGEVQRFDRLDAKRLDDGLEGHGG